MGSAQIMAATLRRGSGYSNPKALEIGACRPKIVLDLLCSKRPNSRIQIDPTLPDPACSVPEGLFQSHDMYRQGRQSTAHPLPTHKTAHQIAADASPQARGRRSIKPCSTPQLLHHFLGHPQSRVAELKISVASLLWPTARRTRCHQ